MRVDRRQFLSGLGGAVALAATGARADMTCEPYGGSQICQVGLRFSPEVMTAQQECEYWCWAACIESIFAIKGFEVSQAEIVERVYAEPVCMPAFGPQIAQAASGSWLSHDGRSFSARADILIDANEGIWRDDATYIAAEELRADRPLIVGALNHAVLLTALTYAEHGDGSVEVLEAIVRDPWPTSPNRRVLSQYEVNQIFFLASVHMG